MSQSAPELVRFAELVRSMRVLHKKLLPGGLTGAELAKLRAIEDSIDKSIAWIQSHRQADRPLCDLAYLVDQMMKAQWTYLRVFRSQENLRSAKAAEKRVDNRLNEILGTKQESLPFGLSTLGDSMETVVTRYRRDLTRPLETE